TGPPDHRRHSSRSIVGEDAPPLPSATPTVAGRAARPDCPAPAGSCEGQSGVAKKRRRNRHPSGSLPNCAARNAILRFPLVERPRFDEGIHVGSNCSQSKWFARDGSLETERGAANRVRRMFLKRGDTEMYPPVSQQMMIAWTVTPLPVS